MPKPLPEVIGIWGGELFIFPNLMILPQAGNAMIYRVRPDGNDPDNCIFEIMSTKTYPAAIKPPRAVVQTVTDIADPEQVLLIPRQDLGNIPRMQKGLHSRRHAPDVACERAGEDHPEHASGDGSLLTFLDWQVGDDCRRGGDTDAGSCLEFVSRQRR